MRGKALAAVFALLVLAIGAPAHAFCGFFVGSEDARLLAEATEVVLLRDGTRTVLSMENRYAGPPEDFALVVPVPVVLQKEQVKTLAPEVFARIDTLTSPRLVEYWEADPCSSGEDEREEDAPATASAADTKEGGFGTRAHVRIEAQFAVGEYDIVILGADDSGALDAWLRKNRYKIPDGAEPYLRPYVAAGSKFFVAKVDTKKVRFGKDGRAKLSPIRFHYDSETFSLPVRLGLLSSSGTQDLVVMILARGRYEVANYPNVTIPTNVDVADSVRTSFPAFYATLFDRTLAKHPKAVVTEYAWGTGSCDPCPGPTLDLGDLSTFGTDVLPDAKDDPQSRWQANANWVVTRLHARYSKDALGEDLVFREAPPIVGGREDFGSETQSQEAKPDATNNFQGRYVIRHPWTGAIRCTKPRFGTWGGPPAARGGPGVQGAGDVAFAKRDVDLPAAVVGSIAALETRGTARRESHADVPWFVLPRGPAGSILIGICVGGAILALLRARRGREAAS